MNELAVWMNGVNMGTLSEDDHGSLSFKYSDGWLRAPDSTPLSVSMPLSGRAYRHEVISPFLWGLMPDNDGVITRWARQYQCSATNIFSLLSHVGTDVAGAAEFHPHDQTPHRGPAQPFQALTTTQIEEMLRGLRDDLTRWHSLDIPGRWSLAGAQPKLALAHHPDAGWVMPRDESPTSHILKPTIPGLADHDLNELLCLSAATRLGLSTEKVTLGHFGDERALVIERFDRVDSAEGPRRVHSEDFCQALGVHPSVKYQNEGGPSLEDMIEVISEHGSSPRSDRHRLLLAAAFNWLILGADAHAKNFSLLLSGHQVRLAPLYDLGSMAPYAHHSKVKLAQKIGGEYQADHIGGRHWRRLAHSAHVDGDEFCHQIITMAELLPGALDETIIELDLGEVEAAAATRIATAIKKWVSICLSKLGD